MTTADESLAELFEQYKDEVRESIGFLDTELVAIEHDPSNSEVIFSIFRHLHSLKGASKMFNVDNIGHIAHKLEDLMQMIDRDNAILQKHPRIVELLFTGADIFRDIITRLETDIGYINLTPEHARFIEQINEQLDQISGKGNALADSARAVLEELESFLPGLEDIDTENLRRAMRNLSSTLKLSSLEGDSSNIRYSYGGRDLTKFVNEYENGLEIFKSGDFSPPVIDGFFKNSEALLQEIFDVADEEIMTLLTELNDGLETFEKNELEVDPIVIEFFTMLLKDLKTHFQTEALEPPEPAQVGDPVSGTEPALAAGVTASQASQVKTIRVDERKIDVFLESVGKLITQSEILNHLQYSFKQARINPALVRDFAAVNRTISNDIVNLQKSIMEVRQVEMDNILKKFPRLVRDISHKMGKEVELVIEGERTPIDKSLLDDVESAMIHIVRNAIDHGLETPREREKAGKKNRGRIGIKVVQEEASVLVEVADDGRGIDFNAVRKRALAKGAITQEQMETMTDKEAESLVFLSGLTTKDEATDISGRGVGLDVVMSNIHKWNGEVALNNEFGRGLSISLRIPITNTLLTKEAILLKVGRDLFCLPLENVLEIVTVAADQVHCHKTAELFQHRNHVITVVDIRSILGMPPGGDGNQGQGRTFIILRGQFETRKAIAADEIVGQQKIVIKDFEMEAFRRLPYYQGLTLLGDGRVVLVLDAGSMVD
ncbi:MAG: chemotaxis protein CheA [Pseudomonadota bacterium]